MNTLGSASPFVDAPITATAFGSNSGLNRSMTLSFMSGTQTLDAKPQRRKGTQKLNRTHFYDLNLFAALRLCV
jgi:hypothetical protein